MGTGLAVASSSAVGLPRGAAPHPGPHAGMGELQAGGIPSVRQAGRTAEPPGTSKARFARPFGQTLAAPGEPAVPRWVPDRGDASRLQP